MKSQLMKISVIIFAAIAILGTAGVVSATDVGTFSINLSHGEITTPGANYTGYVEFTPNVNFPLNSFRVVIASNDSNVIISKSDNVDELFSEYSKFEYYDTPLIETNGGLTTYGFLANLLGERNVTLTANTPYKILPFTIHVNSSITNESVNLSFVHDSLECYVTTDDSSLVSEGMAYLNTNLTGISYVLSNSTANSVVIPNQVSVAIETNESIFDGNVSIFSELSKVIANSSDKYYLNYTSSNKDVIKFYKYGIQSLNMTPRYVVLKGTNSSVITVNLTNMTDGSVIDTKKFTVSTTPIELGADIFNYTANHKYPYGSDIMNLVTADVKASILNHSVGAADSGDDAYTDGYVRDVGALTLTFFNDSKCTQPVVSFDGGTYYFNVSIAANANYNAVENLTIANNSFVVEGALVYGKCVFNKTLYNATTPARMTVEFNASGMELNLAVFNINTTVEEYTYGEYAHYNLSFKKSNYTDANNYSILDGNRTIHFISNKLHPVENVTYFIFEGFPRGDVTMDGKVRANDASVLASCVVNPSSPAYQLTEEQLFYGNIYGYNSVSINEVRQIARYAAGLLDADYKVKQ